ncbi:pyrroline-5-carboxylate reductase dimerization domain-containing protein [Streptomyces sp. NPDC097619]|uniref:pyrroline-5-carboxylate reductase family protein n=1 Tax=Streptomyces sp. NPDC097619 TaxID=3157228 RepID=UPI003321E640
MAFVGCGRIARAVAVGLRAAEGPARPLRGVSRDGAGARVLAAETGLVPMPDLAGAVAGAETVVLAVHPHEAAGVLAGLGPHLEPGQTLVSLVASWPAAEVAAAVGHRVPVVRAVPNTAVAVRAGATVLSVPEGADPAALEPVRDLFAALGPVHVVEDRHQETVSALSGAGPALLARFASALAGGATALGLPPQLAEDLARQATAGTGALLAGPDAELAATIDAVASPGGMTERALERLAGRGLDAAAAEALDAAVRLSLGRAPRSAGAGRNRPEPGPRDTPPARPAPPRT